MLKFAICDDEKEYLQTSKKLLEEYAAQKEEIMDRSYDCYVEIDTNKHAQILSDRGIDIDTLSEQQIKETNTGSNVYATGKVQFVDAMEDLDLKLFMQGV